MRMLVRPLQCMEKMYRKRGHPDWSGDIGFVCKNIVFCRSLWPLLFRHMYYGHRLRIFTRILPLKRVAEVVNLGGLLLALFKERGGISVNSSFGFFSRLSGGCTVMQSPDELRDLKRQNAYDWFRLVQKLC